MSGLWMAFCLWRQSRARDAEARWANRRYALDPKWRAAVGRKGIWR